MQLSTIVPVSSLHPQLDYESNILCLGSCFAENIGDKLRYFGFDVVINPFGIIFNPVSIALLLEKVIDGERFRESDIETTFSYYAHSDLNGQDQEQALDHLNKALENLRDRVEKASHIFITLGTAWVYRHKEKNLIVANCHKQPQYKFTKELLTADQIRISLESIDRHISLLNSQVSICYTLSPVRHIKDGFVENMRSKSRLHDMIQEQVKKQTQYFPAFEIVMDELRDYRFYKPDLIHLNETGVDYVWLCFRESAINNITLPIQKEVEKYRKLQKHRPKNAIAHHQTVSKIKKTLLDKHPYLSLT